MTQKMFCLCAAVALLFAISTVNVASAQVEPPTPEPSAPVAYPCPCDYAPTAVPCRWTCFHTPWFAPGCPAVVTYRVGLFGHVRPIVHAPFHRPFVAPCPVVVAPCPVVVALRPVAVKPRPIVVAPRPVVVKPRPIVVAPCPVVVAPRHVHRHVWTPYVVPPRAVHMPHCAWW